MRKIMLKKIIIILVLISIPVSVFSQQGADTEKTDKKDEHPVLAVFTDVFDIKHLSFIKKVDPKGRGELILVEFQLLNNTDLTRDLYIFVVATNEEINWKKTTLTDRRILPQGSRINYFASYPDSNDNFKYQDQDGKEYMDKYPKDYKAGINPYTGKPYSLDTDIIVRTEILCRYRKRYQYFNYVTLMIYDDEGKLLFRQVHRIDWTRK